MSTSDNAAGPSSAEIGAAYSTLRRQAPWSHSRSERLHHRVLPFATYAPWLNDEAFVRIYEKVQTHTLVDIYRCFELWTLARQCARLEGHFLEVGVWRGGTGAILCKAAQQEGKTVFLADTFKGVVKAGENDTAYVGGEHADTSAGIVEQLLQYLELSNAVLLEGIFPDDTAHRVTGPLAMVHVDVDVYQSSKDTVQWALQRLVRGGVIVFDDYGFLGCEGVATFCEELSQVSGLRFIHNLNGHGVFIKYD